MYEYKFYKSIRIIHEFAKTQNSYKLPRDIEINGCKQRFMLTLHHISNCNTANHEWDDNKSMSETVGITCEICQINMPFKHPAWKCHGSCFHYCHIKFCLGYRFGRVAQGFRRSAPRPANPPSASSYEFASGMGKKLQMCSSLSQVKCHLE